MARRKSRKKTGVVRFKPMYCGKSQKARANGNGKGYEQFELLYNRTQPYPATQTQYDLLKKRTTNMGYY